MQEVRHWRLYLILCGRKINAPGINRTLYTSVERGASDCRYPNGIASTTGALPLLSSPFFFLYFFASRHHFDVRKIFAYGRAGCASVRAEKEEKETERENGDATVSDISLTSGRYTLTGLFHDTWKVLTKYCVQSYSLLRVRALQL